MASNDGVNRPGLVRLRVSSEKLAELEKNYATKSGASNKDGLVRLPIDSEKLAEFEKTEKSSSTKKRLIKLPVSPKKLAELSKKKSAKPAGKRRSPLSSVLKQDEVAEESEEETAAGILMSMSQDSYSRLTRPTNIEAEQKTVATIVEQPPKVFWADVSDSPETDADRKEQRCLESIPSKNIAVRQAAPKAALAKARAETEAKDKELE